LGSSMMGTAITAASTKMICGSNRYHLRRMQLASRGGGGDNKWTFSPEDMAKGSHLREPERNTACPLSNSRLLRLHLQRR